VGSTRTSTENKEFRLQRIYFLNGGSTENYYHFHELPSRKVNSTSFNQFNFSKLTKPPNRKRETNSRHKVILTNTSPLPFHTNCKQTVPPLCCSHNPLRCARPRWFQKEGRKKDGVREENLTNTPALSAKPQTASPPPEVQQPLALRS